MCVTGALVKGVTSWRRTVVWVLPYLFLAALALGGGTAQAQPTAAITSPSPPKRPIHPVRKVLRTPDMMPYLTGDWRGLRSKLTHLGITPTLTYTSDALGNPVGGMQQAFRIVHDVGLAFEFDLEQLAGLHGLEFDVSGAWSSGKDLSADIGSSFSTAQAFSGFDTAAVRLYNLALHQSLAHDRVHIAVGRLGTGDDFAVSPLYNYFVNTAFNSSEISSLGVNLPAFTAYQTATWGLRVKSQPVEGLDVLTGLYYMDPSLGRSSAHGVDFSIRSDQGALAIAQLDYRLHQGKDTAGLPGTYSLGGYYDSEKFPDFSDPAPAQSRGNYGLYVMADQMVYREGGPKSQQGLTLFTALTFAPSHVNTFPFYVMGGAVYQGLFPGRDRDVAALAVSYAKFSKYLSGQDFEMTLEWTYEVVLTSWLIVQPDVQYIIRPGGTGDMSNALVLGWQIAISL